MKTVTQVADDLGISRSLVWYHIKAMGLGTMTGSVMLLSSDDVERIAGTQQREGMVTVSQLMDELGVSREIISRRIKRLGIITEERRRIFLTEEQAEAVRRMGDDL